MSQTQTEFTSLSRRVQKLETDVKVLQTDARVATKTLRIMEYGFKQMKIKVDEHLAQSIDSIDAYMGRTHEKNIELITQDASAVIMKLLPNLLKLYLCVPEEEE